MSRSVESTIIAFDLYGTLLSTDSIATESLAQHFGIEIAKKIATLWRRYQLEYTWRLNSMSKRNILFLSYRNRCWVILDEPFPEKELC